jgi:hypothetical protein
MDTDFWLKVTQILAGLVTPIIVTVLGVVLVRRIEGIKADAAKHSAFHVGAQDLGALVTRLILRRARGQIGFASPRKRSVGERNRHPQPTCPTVLT